MKDINRRIYLEYLPICIIHVKICKVGCKKYYMSKIKIKQFIENTLIEDGVVETGIKGVQIFRVTDSVQCAPVIYEPSVVAIVSGGKEAILDGKRHVYGSDQYLCCPISMPVEAGTPDASPENPLLGVYISLDTKVMTELAIEIQSVAGINQRPNGTENQEAFALARWDEPFANALLRLLELGESPTDIAVLGNGRLREVYYAILTGEVGHFARSAFGAGNEIVRAIEFLSSRLSEAVTIEEAATKAGMSRAVFHRKFKQATTMSPIQFVKSMRLNNAAMKIAGGVNVNEAAMDVGYISPSQFSREFKRMFGQAPSKWSSAHQLPERVA